MSQTLKKLGIEYKDITQVQMDEATNSMKQMRLEQILIGECEDFGWQNLLQRPDLIAFKHPEKIGAVFEETEKKPNFSFYIFNIKNPLRKAIIRVTKFQNYNYFMLLIVTISLIPYCIEQELLAKGLEVVCNVILGIDILLQMIAFGVLLESKAYLCNAWNIVNLLAFIFTWFIFLEKNNVNDVIKTIRMLRFFRFIQEIPILKIQFTAYVSSFLKLKQVLIPIFLVMIYFAIIGMHLFMGLTEYRCRTTPEPVNGVWDADPEVLYLCGIWECPENLYCGNPADYGLPKNMNENDFEEFSWDFIRFDDFFHSLLVIFTFLNVTGWSGTTFMFWKAMTTYVTATYFLVLIVLLAFILSNLLLALFYESFMEKSSIKSSQSKAKKQQQIIEDEQKKKNQEQLMNRLTLMSKKKTQSIQNQTFNIYFSQDQFHDDEVKRMGRTNFLTALATSKNFTILQNLFIILSALAIAIDYKNINILALEQLQIVDFICILATTIETIIQFLGRGIKIYFSKDINKFDFIVMAIQWILIFILIVMNEPIVINHNITIVFFKSLKILRVFRFVYFAKIFYTIALLTRSLLNTLMRLSNILLLWASLMFMIAVVGKGLLQHKLEEEEMTIYFDDFGSALMASVNIFYNEEWHVTMYKYAHQTYVSFFYYILSVILGQIFFIRLLTAVFLNEFSQQLQKIEKILYPLNFKQIMTETVAFFQKSIKKQSKYNTAMLQSECSGKKAEIKEDQVEGKKKNQKKKPKSNSIVKCNISQKDLDEIPNWLQQQEPIQQQDIKSNLSNQFEKEQEAVRQSQLSPIKQNISYKQKLAIIVDSFPVKVFSLLVVLASTIRIALTTPFLDPNSEEAWILKIVNIITTIFFIIQILFNVISKGLIVGEESYLQKSPYNLLNFFVTVAEIVALFLNTNVVLKFLSSLRIIEFIRIGAELNQGINYISQALVKAFQTMIQLSLFCFIILLIYGVFATKILKGQLYSCSGISEEFKVNDKWECMDVGGSWVNSILGYDNIFDSALTLFITATTEAWLGLLVTTWNARGVDLTPTLNHNRWWAVYYQVFFFIGNICMLNMFISLVVDTYQQTKVKAQGMSELDNNQREWLSIKQSINHLKPRVMYEKPKNKIMLFIYNIAESKAMRYCWHFIIILNTISLALYYLRQNSQFRLVLEDINLACSLAFSIEVCSRLIAKFPHIWNRDPFIIIDIMGIVINLTNQFNVSQLNDQPKLVRGFEALSVGFQLLRNYYIIRRFPELEKLFITIFSVVPSAISMLFIMFIFLFIYACLGMELFGYLRSQVYMNGFDLHFRKFSTAMFSLIRVASSEQWWALLVDSVHLRTPDFACIYIDNYSEFQEHGYNGCGTYWAYVYYISFHLIFSLVILNLFIASILGAYEEHAKQEQSAISKYQLHDVLNYWAQYDPQGTGFLNYKQFWKLSSEIAICFGVSVKDLLDPANKKNFLKALNISLYEDGSGLMGYLFHDVILSLTKISVELKYGVRDLESSSYLGKEFIHSYYKGFKMTPYNSGQMSTIIYLQGKARILVNKRRGIKFLDIDKLKKEYQNQNEGDKYDKN